MPSPAPARAERDSAWRRFRGLPIIGQIAIWCGAGFAALLFIGLLGSIIDPTTSGTPAAAVDRVSGTMPINDDLGLGDSEAEQQLAVYHVYCYWDGDNVKVHAVFHNSLNAHVTIHVQPTYDLANAGKHGDGFDSEMSAGVDAEATRDWTGDAGHPVGVNGQPVITNCGPSINEVDLG